MSKNFLKLLAVSAVVAQALAPVAAFATLASFSSTPSGLPTYFASCQTTSCIVMNIVNILLAIVFLIAVVFLLIGGFRYIISQGNEEGVEKAKGTITNAIIGVVVTVLAWIIVAAIRSLLEAGSGGA